MKPGDNQHADADMLGRLAFGGARRQLFH